jgi:hypothetical protein
MRAFEHAESANEEREVGHVIALQTNKNTLMITG